MDITFLVFAGIAVLFAGISNGGFGSGAAFASSAILAIILPPAAALGIMLPLLMLMDTTSLRAYWGKWSWTDARLLLIGSLPGTFLGAVFFVVVNPDAIRVLIGAISLAFVAWQMLSRSRFLSLNESRFGARAGLIAGVILGFTSFVSHAGGPAAAVYLLGQRLSKTTYQATTVIIFALVNFAKAVLYAGMGIFTFEGVTTTVIFAPVAVLGTWLGIRAHFLVSERLFFALTYVMLTLTGIKLIYDGLV
jgi:uncharacterized membrane protein YfcA